MMISQQVKIIHLAMVAGLFMLAAVMHTISPNKNLILGSEDIRFSEVLLFGILSFITGQILTRKMAASFRPTTNKEKQYQSKYLTLKILQWAFVEGAALVNFVTYFVQGTLLNFYAGIGFAIAMILIYPSEKDLFSLFKITPADIFDRNEINFN